MYILQNFHYVFLDKLFFVHKNIENETVYCEEMIHFQSLW